MEPLVYNVLDEQKFDHGYIIRALKRLYADPFRQQRADKRLRSFRQGDKPFVKFLAEWEYLTWLAGNAAYPHSQRITSLRYALSSALQKRLDYRETDENLPSSYDAFVELLHRLAA